MDHTFHSFFLTQHGKMTLPFSVNTQTSAISQHVYRIPMRGNVIYGESGTRDSPYCSGIWASLGSNYPSTHPQHLTRISVESLRSGLIGRFFTTLHFPVSQNLPFYKHFSGASGSRHSKTERHRQDSKTPQTFRDP